MGAALQASAGNCSNLKRAEESEESTGGLSRPDLATQLWHG
eukprot:CAMPEP_0180780328 /NCGR_PEP_ID=MMETSP1038_2-20121128/46943_1 /TAXON_ID=632150 /ORGANISM="Azadinium spinosum, Strain 3D9" /LENGTH=40 /DNA_ID= /DNA_START= /DNA_END= /DNA_ORIENTATION=